MELTLGKGKAGGKSRSRLQKRFDKLRAALERERRRGERFKREIDELVEFHQQRSLEHDRRLLDDLVQLADRLIRFAGRKSLSEWHREELDDWLLHLVSHRIRPVDEAVAERLRLDYRQAVARSLGITEEELDVRLDAQAEGLYMDDDLDDDDPDDDEDDGYEVEQEDLWQDDLFGFDAGDFEADFAPGDQEEPDEPDWTDEEAREDLGRAVINGRWARDLFRRAAQALHPDREPDPQRREAKQERMRELLAARKQGDFMALLSIYADSVRGNSDLVLAESEMKDVCDALEQQLETLEFERLDYVYSHPLRAMVRDVLYHETKQGRARKRRQWQEVLEGEGRELQRLHAYLRNLTCLKEVLADRRDERASTLLDVIFEGTGP